MERLMFHFVLYMWGFFPSSTHLHLEGGPIEVIKNKKKKTYLSKEKLIASFLRNRIRLKFKSEL